MRHREHERASVPRPAALSASVAAGTSPQPAPTYEDYRRILRGRSFPLAYVDLEPLDANIAAALARAGEKRGRVASKSVRSVALQK